MKEDKGTRENRLVIYRNFEYQDLFDDMCALFTAKEGEARPDVFACANQLIELAVTYGFEGNLWHCFLAFCMANHENAYSTSCEILGAVKGTIHELAEHDFAIMKQMFSWDICKLDEMEHGIFSMMMNYKSISGNSSL